ncbi:hypothetical protein STEG23_026434, partial [Scotinomys teguina]
SQLFECGSVTPKPFSVSLAKPLQSSFYKGFSGYIRLGYRLASEGWYTHTTQDKSTLSGSRS